MAGAVRCSCGSPLLQGMSERGVTPVGSDREIPFRRTTDHVVCPTCFRSYSVRDLIESLRERDEDADLIAQLERLAEGPEAG